ncbi:MAG TPA: DUF3717 domain-containing protein [Rhodocyclaceae bacterium]|jgi:hypothetical protein|nr:DUF3717 domain-containing protein [Rhodocyclaceae bacterium]
MSTVRTQYSVEEIGHAIGYWLAHEQAAPLSIGPNARALADIYGIMLYQRRAYVAVAQLTPTQADALNIALHQLPLL